MQNNNNSLTLKWGSQAAGLTFEAIPTVIIENLPGMVTNAEYKLYITLTRFLRPGEMIARVSLKRLAAIFRCTEKAVGNLAAGLRDAGVIAYHQPHSGKSGEYLCNEYDLTPGLHLCLEEAAEGELCADPEEPGVTAAITPEEPVVPTAPEEPVVPTKQTSSLSLTELKNDDDEYARARDTIPSFQYLKNSEQEERTAALIHTVEFIRKRCRDTKHYEQSVLNVFNRVERLNYTVTNWTSFLPGAIMREMAKLEVIEEQREQARLLATGSGSMRPASGM